jgi:hypothetical protein
MAWGSIAFIFHLGYFVTPPGLQGRVSVHNIPAQFSGAVLPKQPILSLLNYFFFYKLSYLKPLKSVQTAVPNLATK